MAYFGSRNPRQNRNGQSFRVGEQAVYGHGRTAGTMGDTDISANPPVDNTTDVSQNAIMSQDAQQTEVSVASLRRQNLLIHARDSGAEKKWYPGDTVEFAFNAEQDYGHGAMAIKPDEMVCTMRITLDSEAWWDDHTKVRG